MIKLDKYKITIIEICLYLIKESKMTLLRKSFMLAVLCVSIYLGTAPRNVEADTMIMKGIPNYAFQPNSQDSVIVHNQESGFYREFYVEPDDRDLVGLVFSLPDDKFLELSVKGNEKSGRLVFDSFLYDGYIINNLDQIPIEWISLLSKSFYTVEPEKISYIEYYSENKIVFSNTELYLTKEDYSYWVSTSEYRINLPFYSVVEVRKNNTPVFYIFLLDGGPVIGNNNYKEMFMPNATFNVDNSFLYETAYTWFVNKPLYYLNGILYRQYFFEN